MAKMTKSAGALAVDVVPVFADFSTELIAKCTDGMLKAANVSGKVFGDQLKAACTRAGVESGQSFADRVAAETSTGMTKVGADVQTTLVKAATRAGTDAGKQAGSGIVEGTTSAMVSAARVLDAGLLTAAKSAGKSIQGALPSDLVRAAELAGADAGKVLNTELVSAARVTGRLAGKELSTGIAAGQTEAIRKTADETVRAGASSGLSFGKGFLATMGGLVATASSYLGLMSIRQVYDSVIEGGEKLQESTDRLQIAAKNSGVAWDKLAPALDGVQQSGERLGFSATDITDAYGTLITRTGNVTVSTKEMAEAENLARYKGIDLASATDIVNKANLGNAKTLKDLGIILPAHATELQKAAAVAAYFGKVTGQAAGYSETFAGKQQILKVQFQDLTEKIGMMLIPALSEFMSWIMDKIVPAMEDKFLPAVEAAYVKYLPAFKDGLETVKEVAGKLWTGLKAVYDFINQHFSQTQQKDFLELIAGYVILSKTGVLKLGMEIVGAGKSLMTAITGGVLQIASGGMQRAGDTMSVAAIAMQKAADTMAGGGAAQDVVGTAGGAVSKGGIAGLLFSPATLALVATIAGGALFGGYEVGQYDTATKQTTPSAQKGQGDLLTGYSEGFAFGPIGAYAGVAAAIIKDPQSALKAVQDLGTKVKDTFTDAAKWVTARFDDVSKFIHDIPAKWTAYFTGLGDDIVKKFTALDDYWRQLPTRVMNWVKSLPDKFANFGGQLVGYLIVGIVKGVPALIDEFKSWLPRAAKAIGDEQLAFAARIQDLMDRFAQWVQKGVDDAIAWVHDIPRRVREELAPLEKAYHDAVDSISRIFGDAVDSAMIWIHDIPDRVGAFLNSLPQQIGDIVNQIPGVFEYMWNDVVRNCAGGVNSVIDLINSFLGGINSITDPFNIHVGMLGHVMWGSSGMPSYAPGSIGAAHGRAAGGLLSGPGTGTSDSIPLWGSAGEYVVRAAAVDTVGVGFMDLLNRADRFADGGLLSGTTVPVLSGLRPPWLGGLTQGMLGKLLDAVTAKVTSAVASMVSGAGAGVQVWAPLVAEALAMLGQSLSWLPTVMRRMNQESGGNPLAVNLWDSNALRGDPSRGLMQTIGSTFEAYRSPSLPDNIYSPLANIYAGLNYALHTYGSLAALDRPGGYDDGGLLPPGISLAYNGSRQPEPVLTSGQWDAITAPAHGATSLTGRLYLDSGQFLGIVRGEVSSSRDALGTGITQRSR